MEKEKSGSGNVGKDGFVKHSFGADDKENYRIADGYEKKDESPARSEGTSVQSIAHHSVTGELYSGDPNGHGHKNKAGGSKSE